MSDSYVVNGTIEKVNEGLTKNNKKYYSFEIASTERGTFRASWFSESGARFNEGDEVTATIEESGMFKNITMMGRAGEQPTLEQATRSVNKAPPVDSPAFLGMIFNKSVDVALASCQKVGQEGSTYYDLGENNARLLEKLETTFDDLRTFAKTKQTQYGSGQ